MTNPRLQASFSSKLPQVGTTIFTVMSKMAQDHGAINLSQGFPDFQASPALIELIFKHMKTGSNQYAPMQGIMSLREQISEKTTALYGNDIDDTTSPLEAGLGWITKLKKKSDFPSKEIFTGQKKQGVTRKLVGIQVDDRRVPRHGYPVCDEQGNEIGVVTSGTLSPTLQVPLGMAYVPTFLATEGTHIFVKAGAKMLNAKVTSVPFVKSASMITN